MIPALALFVILTLSVIIIRAAAVALRITGLPNETARFQARSAFTGTGFTTSESEAIINHPVRRRIVSMLMIIGNVGLVTVMSTVIVSLAGSSWTDGALLIQILWLAGVLLLLWFVALNPAADRIMCRIIGRLLQHSRALKSDGAELLLQCPQGNGVYRIRMEPEAATTARVVGDLLPPQALAFGLHRADGSYLQRPTSDEPLRPQDEVYLYGSDHALKPVQRRQQPPPEQPMSR